MAAARRGATREQWDVELLEIRRDARRAWVTHVLELCQEECSFDATKKWIKHHNACHGHKMLSRAQMEVLLEPFRTRFEFP
jgi:hypothetical protein